MKSRHNFSSAAEEERLLIYNFSPVYGGSSAIFVQNYYFDWRTKLPNIKRKQASPTHPSLLFPSPTNKTTTAPQPHHHSLRPCQASCPLRVDVSPDTWVILTRTVSSLSFSIFWMKIHRWWYHFKSFQILYGQIMNPNREQHHYTDSNGKKERTCVIFFCIFSVCWLGLIINSNKLFSFFFLQW